MAEERDRQQDAPTFKVSDRRKFAGGEASPSPEAPRPEPPPERPPPEPEPPAEGEPAEEGPVDFIHLVMSLAHTALFQLGDVPDPVTGQRGSDIGAASRTIDLLALLREKTRGNLTPQEERLLEASLSELKLRYVAARGTGAR